MNKDTSKFSKTEQKLKNSDVLIFDSAYAVALKYDRSIKPAPFITYKSKNVDSSKIAANNISLPIIKHHITTEIALNLKINEIIPYNMFLPVANIIAQAQNKVEQDFDNFLDDKFLFADFKQKLCIELGENLKEMVKSSDLLEKIDSERKRTFSELGLLISSINVRNNLEIPKNKYLIKIGHNTVGDGIIYPDKNLVLLMDSDDSTDIDGIKSIEPAFGLPAIWINEKDCNRAESLGFTIVSPSAVISTHLNEVIKKNAADLLTRHSIYQILEKLKISNSIEYVKDIMHEVSIETVQTVLFNLLKEQVPINEIEKILETISINVHNNDTIDEAFLTQKVREALARSICSKNISDGGVLLTIVLSPEVEKTLTNGISSDRLSLVIEQTYSKLLFDSLAKEMKKALADYECQPVILCSSTIRLVFRNLIEKKWPQITVMSYNEITSETKTKTVGNIRVSAKIPNNNKKNKKTNTDFNLDFVNCSRDLGFITERIIKNKNLDFSMCIYGESGTGKSAYARYLADKLGIKIITKSAADVLDKYIGNSEKYIKEAFKEAKDKGAMLIIDEIDSFLYSRGIAKTSWEITMVNQMLTCMEDFDYPFICTTNYIDRLDQASLRRFTFKMKFGFLKPEKIETAFKYVFNMKPNTEILNMQGLTVSDFVSIKRECDILEIKDVSMIAKMLEETVSLKESEELRGHMGFNLN